MKCVIWTITPSWAINVAFIIIIINYIEFQVPQNYLSPQPITSKIALFLGKNQDVLPFKIQKSIHS